jgi:ribosomal protein L7/L12
MIEYDYEKIQAVFMMQHNYGADAARKIFDLLFNNVPVEIETGTDAEKAFDSAVESFLEAKKEKDDTIKSWENPLSKATHDALKHALIYGGITQDNVNLDEHIHKAKQQEGPTTGPDGEPLHIQTVDKSWGDKFFIVDSMAQVAYDEVAFVDNGVLTFHQNGEKITAKTADITTVVGELGWPAISNQVPWIKRYREISGAWLKTSKQVCDYLRGNISLQFQKGSDTLEATPYYVAGPDLHFKIVTNNTGWTYTANVGLLQKVNAMCGWPNPINKNIWVEKYRLSSGLDLKAARDTWRFLHEHPSLELGSGVGVEDYNILKGSLYFWQGGHKWVAKIDHLTTAISKAGWPTKQIGKHHNLVSWMKAYREASGVGLLEAKRAGDFLIANPHICLEQ